MMKEKYGSYPVIKERARPEIMSYVFDDRPGVAQIFSRIEQDYLKVADGAVEAIKYLREQGIEVSIVAELKRTLGPIGTDMVSAFLIRQGVVQYFDELITPQGKSRPAHRRSRSEVQGLVQRSGGPVRRARRRSALAEASSPRDGVMVGDKEWSDITPALKRGFQAIHYSGLHLPCPVQRLLRDQTSVRAKEHHQTGGVRR